jgi:hypothetical protein
LNYSFLEIVINFVERAEYDTIEISHFSPHCHHTPFRTQQAIVMVRLLTLVFSDFIK